MADITLVKISALPAAEQIGAEDLLPVVQEGATKAIAYGVIKDDIAEELAPDATLSEAGKAADAKAVGDALALKADTTTVTAEVNRIDATLNTKVNNATYTAEVERIDGDIATKADAAATTAALATKANANEVTAELALKADAATVNAALATKANTTTVNSALALKADKTELSAGLATKQNVLTFDSTPTQGSTNPVTSGGIYQAIPALDDTLTVAGDAADAKITGDAITELKNDLDVHSDIISTNLMGIDVQENLYPGAADWSGDWTASDAVNIINSTALFNGYPAMRSKVSWNRYFRLIPITAGKTYTFEAWIKCDVAGSIFAYATWPNHVDNVATISANSKQVNNIPANTWTKITFTFNCTASGNVGPFVLCSSGAFDFAHYVFVEGDSVFSLSDTLNSKTPLSDFNAVKDKTDIIVSNVNALENLTITENKVYERNTANVIDNNYANIYPVIRIESGKTYYYRNLYAYFCLVKYDGGTKTPFSDDQSVTVNGSFTASDNGNVYISVRRGQSGFVFTDSKTLYDSGLTASFNTIDVQNVPKIYHVEKDGSGDFDSLVEAIEEATKYMDSVVYVGAGTWDLIDELGTEYVESVSISKRGVYLKNRVHLIFNPKAVVECIYTGTRADTIAWLSAFNAGQYGFTLEGANIKTGNVRYCVHDERDSDADAYTNIYKNCVMYHDSSYAQGGQNQCLGGGLGLNGHIVVDGCVFENPNVDNTTLLSWHNSAGANAKSFIDVHGCYVKGTNTMRFRYYGATPDTQKTTILCHDNLVGNEIAFGPETEGSTNVNMELLAWNNTVRT